MVNAFAGVFLEEIDTNLFNFAHFRMKYAHKGLRVSLLENF